MNLWPFALHQSTDLLVDGNHIDVILTDSCWAGGGHAERDQLSAYRLRAAVSVVIVVMRTHMATCPAGTTWRRFGSSVRGTVGAPSHTRQMVRKMTPAQLKSAVQKAQRDQKQAIENYNRAVRKHNAAVTKAVNDYNREVRTYNSKVRTHNRQVENQRQRIKQEIARLNSRPSGATFVTYRASTKALVNTYETVEARLASRPGSPADQRFLDLASDEAANSVYLANALEGDGDSGDDPTEDELRAPSMASELAAFGEDLVNRWTGALYALSPQNPDAARHFCTSAREVVVTMLDISAPDAAVRKDDPVCEMTEQGAVTRRSKVSYLLRRHGVTMEGITDLVAEDIDNVLSLFRTFNDGTHGHAGRFTMTELSAIRTRVESAIGFIYEVVVA